MAVDFSRLKDIIKGYTKILFTQIVSPSLKGSRDPVKSDVSISADPIITLASPSRSLMSEYWRQTICLEGQHFVSIYEQTTMLNILEKSYEILTAGHVLLHIYSLLSP